jgi:hypothetical protein
VAASVASSTPAAPALSEQPAPTQTGPIVPVAEAVAANQPTAPVEQPSAIDNFLASDEALPIAGGAALAILVLGGGAGLVSRRRRRRREAEDAQWQEQIENTPAALGEDMTPEPAEIAEPQRATMEPTFVRAFADSPAAAPSPAPVAATAAAATGPTTDLPEDFDLSRFGPHMQAAYKGPTPDNPSLSLKYRLRRAAALDQMARKAGAVPGPAPRADAPVAKPATAQPANGEFLLRHPVGKPSVKVAYGD